MRDVWIVAWNECQDAFRSRRAIVLFLIYFAGGLLATNFFVSFVAQLEKQVLEALRVTPGASIGATTQTLWESPLFRRAVEDMTRNKELAGHLVGTPPIALFYGAMSFWFAPVLMMLISTTRVAEELGSGSARFVLFRCPLSSWAIGKYVGQALLLIPALLLSAVASWIIGYWRLSIFPPFATAVALLGFGGKALIYTWSWLGLAIGVSQLTRSTAIATTFGFLGMMVLSAAHAVASFRIKRGGTELWEIVRWITPQGYRLDLWWPTASHILPAMVVLTALGMCYFALGYVFLRRRDL
jgi:ABC-type transport system involved in multi-copper enzyme maturation permease subunit